MNPSDSKMISPDHIHLENVDQKQDSQQDMQDDEVQNIQLHARTWIAFAAFFLLNYVQVLALQGQSSVLNYIGTDLGNTKLQSWAVVVLSLTQGTVGPLIGGASDAFQARKSILVVCCIIAFVGACIAPGATTIYRLIGANVLIGVGFATVPLAYAVPSEILPRRWRPLVASVINSAAILATISGPFAIGALLKRNAHMGWRYYFWFQAALWGLTAILILIGYNPPKRHTIHDDQSFVKRILSLDLVGFALLTSGLVLFIVGTSLGGGLYSWKAAPTLATLVLGFVLLVAFGIYEWKGTKTGFLHHDLFQSRGAHYGRTFGICVLLLICEAVMAFAYALFYPILTQILFTTDPLLVVARSQAAWVPAFVFTVVWGWISTRYRTIREPMLAGFLIFTSGFIGLSTLQPGDSIKATAFSVLVGIGLGAPLGLVITGVQLAAPHKLIATATACTTSARAVAGAVFSAIDSAAFTNRLGSKLPEYIATAAISAGLPAASVPAFIQALLAGDQSALASVAGVDPGIIAAGVQALQQAYADSFRVCFIIAIPTGIVACIACWFIGDLKAAMTCTIDAPLEVTASTTETAHVHQP